MGEILTMITKSKRNIFKKTIAMVLISGFVLMEGMAIQANAAETTESKEPTAIVNECDFLNMRSSAGVSGRVVGRINTGDKVDVLNMHYNGWIQIKTVDKVTGWVNGRYLTIKGGTPNKGNSDKVESILKLAYQQQGKPYRWGATGPNSFDCSGFTSYVYKNGAGITIPRVSRSQATVGTYVNRASLQPGDLVFFGSGKSITHVGMYVGDQKFIHSPQTGDVVKVSKMDTGSYSKRFITARRIVQN
jgi:cell wall-associated NlpC family hydrolase